MNTVQKAPPVKKLDIAPLSQDVQQGNAQTAKQDFIPSGQPIKHAEPELKDLSERKLPPVTTNAEKPMAAGLQATRPSAPKHLSPNSISELGYLRNSWDVIAARGVTIANVILPEYWLHVATKLRPTDKIEVIAEDGTWYAQLLVVNADRTWAKVFVLMHHDLTKATENTPARAEDEYDVEWTPAGKWTITKKTQKGQPPLKDGFLSRLEAYQWLDGHIKSIS